MINVLSLCTLAEDLERGPVECWLSLGWEIIAVFHEQNPPDNSHTYIHQTYSCLFSNRHNSDSYLCIFIWTISSPTSLHLEMPELWITFRKCATFTASVRPWPVITFLLLLFPCYPSSPYQRPSFLIQHASMVTFSHECPGNPPHLLFKSMQITTSKSSRASSETELCTCGDWTSEGGGGHVNPFLILSYVYVMLPFKRSHAFF